MAAVVQAAAQGAALGGGSRHTVAAAVSAAIRTYGCIADHAPTRAAGTSDSITRVEHCLWVIGRGVGLDSKIDITGAKSELRRRGRFDLASRLGRETKARNAQAHPDAGLLAAIEEDMFSDEEEVRREQATARQQVENAGRPA